MSFISQTRMGLEENRYIKIGRFVRLPGSVSECRTAGMPIMSHCQPYNDHAALRSLCRFPASAFGSVGLTCPTGCMRQCLHRCVRWEDEEVAGQLHRAAMSYSLSTLREKGEEEEGRGGRRKEWCVRCVLLLPHSWTPQNIYAWRAACRHSFVDIRKLKLRKHACHRSL